MLTRLGWVNHYNVQVLYAARGVDFLSLPWRAKLRAITIREIHRVLRPGRQVRHAVAATAIQLWITRIVQRANFCRRPLL